MNMSLNEAIIELEEHGYMVESSIKGNFVNGEKGGEDFHNLGNDYDYDFAKRVFASAICGQKCMTLPMEEVDKYWYNYINKTRKNQFEKTYQQFEKYKNGEPIKLYRGLVMEDGKEVDEDLLGICWSFNKNVAKRWVEEIHDNMVYRHIGKDLKLYIYTCETDIDNCDLPYSIWLAGRFERTEWEVRLKDETQIVIKGRKEI